MHLHPKTAPPHENPELAFLSHDDATRMLRELALRAATRRYFS